MRSKQGSSTSAVKLSDCTQVVASDREDLGVVRKPLVLGTHSSKPHFSEIMTTCDRVHTDRYDVGKNCGSGVVLPFILNIHNP